MRFLIVVIVTLVLMSSYSFADELETLKNENVELRQRMEKLEGELKEIKQMIGERSTTAVIPVPPPVVEKVVEKEKPSVQTKYPVELYGYIKLDAAYDTARMDNGNFPRWVLSESTNDNDDEFNMTARQSRFGLNIKGPDISDSKTSGKVEVDFYEGGDENKNRLMMRHAYLQLDWPESDFSILAGQTTDVISPLFPPTVNYGIEWWSGNPGYRRPQLRLTKGFDVSGDSDLLFQCALTRTIGDTGTGFDPGDTGEDAGFPTLQGGAGYSFPLFADKKATVGLSGHWGKEEYDTDNTGGGIDYDTWSANIDITLPLAKKLTLKGEIWTGENLDTYFAGIGQGVNTTLRREIGSSGGWTALSLGPFNKWRFNLGGGIDNPEEDDLNDGNRTKNASIFGNVTYDINESVQMGLELSQWETDYKNQENGDSFRVQSSLIYNF